MSGADELIHLLTDRLSPDPELQRDVAAELRAHLEDCAAEFRQAGQSDEQAAASAAKAMGDPRELSDQLWQANRGRMRLRGVLRWAAGAALLPAAVAAVAILVLTHGWPLRPDLQFGSSWAPERLTKDQAFLLYGDPQARSRLEEAKSISDRWPDNPVYYGNYAIHQLTVWEGINGTPPPHLAEGLAMLDKGERIDPKNAYYNYAKASWLIRASSTLADDPKHTYELRDARGQVTTRPFSLITIQDPAMFRRGLEEFRRGLAKPFFASRSIDMTNERLALLPQHQKFLDVVREAEMTAETILPDLQGWLGLGKSLSAYALARVGTDGQEAIGLTRSAVAMADQMGKGSQTLIEMFVAVSIRATALASERRVYAELGRQNMAKQAQQELDRQQDLIRDIRSRPSLDRDQIKHTGMLWSLVTPALPGLRANFAPLRTAETWAVTQFALLELLAVLVVISAALAVISAVSWAINRRQNRPMLLFVGWRRIARICLLSIVLPLAVYGVYAYAVTAPPDAYGLNCSAGRVVMEFAVVVSVVCTLLLGLSYTAVRKRCEELGLEVPPPRHLRKRWIVVLLASLLALAVIGYEIYWWSWIPTARPGEWAGPWYEWAGVSVPSPTFPSSFGVILGGTMLVFTAIFVIVEFARLLRKRLGLFRRTLFRSLSPILSSAVILVAIVCGYALSRAESSAARQIVGDAAMGFTNEIEKSDYSLLRQQFGTWQAQDAAEMAR
jgi:hypothetical protein